MDRAPLSLLTLATQVVYAHQLYLSIPPNWLGIVADFLMTNLLGPTLRQRRMTKHDRQREYARIVTLARRRVDVIRGRIHSKAHLLYLLDLNKLEVIFEVDQQKRAKKKTCASSAERQIRR